MTGAGAASSSSPFRWRFDAIGTVWEIETARPLADAVRLRVTEVIDGFDRVWSRFREDSVVAALAPTGGDVPAPDDAVAMLDVYAALSRATGGAVNPLVGDSLVRLGYGPDRSLRPGEPLPAPANWDQRLTWSNRRLRLTGSGTIDVGAVGKGRLVDIVLSTVVGMTAEHSGGPAAGSVVVDAGGDIAARGSTVRVGLEHPYDPRRAIGVVELTDAALCGSAVNRRSWGDGLHHVLDARTGVPVRAVAATWALAPDAMHADAIATALFFDGGAALAAEWGVHWVRMLTDGRAERSPGCPAELFTR